MNGVDLEAYLRDRVAIKNLNGGRGYTSGIRTFDCPWCGDRKGRGWMNVVFGTAGCFNAGCDACPRVDGGAVEWARAWENERTRGETIAFLRAKYPGSPVLAKPIPLPAYKDFCLFPQEMRRFRLDPSQLQLMFEKFAVQKWNLRLSDLMGAGAGWCVQGRLAWRMIFPVLMGHRPVGFQARTIKAAEAKYLTSRHGKEGEKDVECGRPAEAMLYGLDDVPPGAEIVLVEGIPDTLCARKLGLWSVGLMGTILTAEKLSMIVAARPSKIVVALDDEPETASVAADVIENFLSWGIPAEEGNWIGSKDAGGGGKLGIRPRSLANVLSRKLKT